MTPGSGGAVINFSGGQPGAGGNSAPQVASAQSLGGVAPVPIVLDSPEKNTVYHVSSQYSPDEKAAGTLIASLVSSFSSAGFIGPVAVAVLVNGTSVFATADGIGVLPHGVRLPENLVPLSEFHAINEQFRADMTGCRRPGYVLKIASDLGLIPEVRALMSTEEPLDNIGVTYITEDMLKGAPYVSTPITRDLFSKVSSEDIPLALESLKQAWNVSPDVNDLDDLEYAVIQARWDKEGNESALKALATWLIADAEAAARANFKAEAGYVLRQLLYLPEPSRV